MAQKSTRARIKYQADKIQGQLDRVLVHLKQINDLSGEQSKYINEWLPPLVSMFTEMKKTVAKFEDGL